MEDILTDIETAAIPLEIELSHNDIVTPPPKPPPIYFHVPRSSLMFAVSNAVLVAFSPYTADLGREPNVWLESSGFAVPWHLPVGVLADVALANGKALPLVFVARVTTDQVPSFVVPANNAKMQYVMASHKCKMATSVLFGDSRPFLNLHPDNATSLTEFALRLMPTRRYQGPVHEAMKCLRQTAKEVERIPVCVHIASSGKSVMHSIGFDAAEDMSFAKACRFLKIHSEGHRVLVYGIEPAADTPILWMWEHMCYGDLVLHFVLVTRE